MNDLTLSLSNLKIPAMFYNGLYIVLVVLGLIVLHAIFRGIFSKKKNNMQENKTYLFPKAIRVWHWCNVVIFLVLLVTGLLAWIKLMPKDIFLPTHLVFAIMFIFSWAFYVAYNAKSNFENYKLSSGDYSNIAVQVKFYLTGIFKGAKHPHTPKEADKFNSLQKVTYIFLVFVLMPMFIITGMLEQIESIHKLMMQIHIFFCTFVSLLFIIVHIYMATCGDYVSQKLKAMIDGYDRHSI